MIKLIFKYIKALKVSLQIADVTSLHSGYKWEWDREFFRREEGDFLIEMGLNPKTVWPSAKIFFHGVDAFLSNKEDPFIAGYRDAAEAINKIMLTFI